MAITKRWIIAWAAEYDTAYDEKIARLGGKRTATCEDVEHVIGWKSPRVLSRFQRYNQRQAVEAAVRTALMARNPDDALASLTGLNWVGERIASAILAAFRPDAYTVMDWRAWKSLTNHGYLEGLGRATWRASWSPYLSTCGSIAREMGVDLTEPHSSVHLL